MCYVKKTSIKQPLLSLWIQRYKYYGINANVPFCYFYNHANYEQLANNDIVYEKYQHSMGFSKHNMTEEKVIYNEKSIEDGLEGGVCITSIVNYAMPLIRYLIGNRGILWHRRKCECGQTGYLGLYYVICSR